MSAYTNGASLEDCHTNVFVLTELNGLKWRKFVAGSEEQTRGCWEVGEEPILRAYGRCLSEGLLCVWRRSAVQDRPQPSQNKIDIRLTGKKELWLFWYGDEPEKIKKFTSSLTSPVDDEKWNGSWERGIDYEVRTLLFKALHNLIERHLLTKNFVRLGKWFVQPLEADSTSSTSYVLAINFSFFVHGENNVCFTVNTQRQPPVYRIARKHLAEKRRQVILAPWCLSAQLTPSGYGQDLPERAKAQANKQWREWLDFFPFPRPDNMENLGYVDPVEKERQERATALALPQMVEVSVAGVRMNHPSCLVLTLSREDAEPPKQQSPGKKSTPTKRQLAPTPNNPTRLGRTITESLLSGNEIAERTVCDLIPSRKSASFTNLELAQNNAVNPGGIVDSRTSSTSSLDSEPHSQKLKNDVLRKEGCACPPGTSPSGMGGSGVGNYGGGVPSKGALKFANNHQSRNWEKPSNKLGKSGIFHRRSPLTVMEDGRQGVGNVHPSISTPLTSPTLQPPTISTSNLPPHEPITQMISPVPPPTNTGSADSLDQPPSNFPFKSTYSSSSCTTTNRQSVEEVVKTEETSFDQVVRSNMLSWEEKESLLKRPRIEESEVVNPAYFWNEEMEANHVFLREPSRTPWIWNPTVQSRTNYQPHANLVPPIVKQENVEEYRTLEEEKPPPVNNLNEDPLISDLQGLIHISDPGNVAVNNFSPTPQEQQEGVGQGKPGRGLSQRELQPSASLPDNFMDTSTNLNDPLLDHHNPTLTESNGMHFISPPASNEREDEMRMCGGGGGKGTGAASHVVGGPPSVGPYAKIFPTPPSMEAVATSPESLTRQVYSISGPASGSLPLPMATSGREPSSSSSILDSKPNYSAAFRNIVTFAPHQIRCVNEGQGLRTRKCNLVFDPPRKGAFITSKFFGPAKLTDRPPITDKNLVYKPSEQSSKTLATNSLQRTKSALEANTSTSSALDTIDMKQPSTPINPFYRQNSFGKPSPYMSQPILSPSQGPPSSVGNLPRTPRTPGGTPHPHSIPREHTDIHSPLSNASCSTPYARNVNSMENPVSQMGVGAGVPEAHSLVATLLLSDTFIDLYRDISFDSCSLCACNSVPNISGLEHGLYVNASAPPPSDFSSRIQCNCGFSAVRHRYLSVCAGLFFEDEAECSDGWGGHVPRVPTEADSQVMKLSDVVRQLSLVEDLAPDVWKFTSILREANRMLSSPKDSCSDSLDGCVRDRNGMQHYADFCLSKTEIQDFSQQCNAAMEAACMVMDCTIPSISDPSSKNILSNWGYQRTVNEAEAEDVESLSVARRVTDIVGELMEESVGTGMEGPLTWRHLERKSMTGTAGGEDECQPEPVPHLLLTTERDFVQVSPLALRLWDRLLLEPYSQAKDVVYLGVIPEHPHILHSAHLFFHELSKVYEFYKFGRHLPYTHGTDEHVKGIKQIGGVDWLHGRESMPDLQSKLENKMRAYEDAIRMELKQIFQSRNLFDRNFMRRHQSKENQPPLGSESMPPPPTPDPSTDNTPNSTDPNSDDTENKSLPHVVVVYLINPIPYRPERSQYTANQGILSLLKAYLSVVKELPEEHRPFVQVEIIPLEKMLDYVSPLLKQKAHNVDYSCPSDKQIQWGGDVGPLKIKGSESMRTMAFSVFSQTRSLTTNCLLTSHAKCLTGFGPAAAHIRTIQRSKTGRISDSNTFRLYCPPFVLPPMSGSQRTGREVAPVINSCKAGSEEGTVLFITYCMSEAQNWLIAAATDDNGSMLENVLINLVTPEDRKLARTGDVIRNALTKLWEFVMGVLASGSKPWRLVVGRLGRLGHGELKIWAQLLCKSNLKKTSHLLREQCYQCNQITGFHETPAILSACLLSTEPEGNVRVFTKSFKPDERFGQGAKHRPLSTPEDVSCTHILVFPTSASLSFSPNGGKADETEDDFNFNFDVEIDEGLGDDIFNLPTSAEPRSANFDLGAVVELSQQPLAIGLYISTAPAPGLPSWFWATCPGARQRCPVHLKSALHLHTARVQESDEFAFEGEKSKKGAENSHYLDSRFPPDVLRYVLETYNALSWLGVDLVSGDRKSCLPIHIQALLRLYHSATALLNQ